jgi:hypothetical protein
MLRANTGKLYRRWFQIHNVYGGLVHIEMRHLVDVFVTALAGSLSSVGFNWYSLWRDDNGKANQ